MAAGSWLAGGAARQRAALSYWPRPEREGGADEAMEGGEAGGGLLQQILSLRLVPRSGNGTAAYSNPLAAFSEMWYGVFLWALVSSLSFHAPAALLALFTLRRHKYGRFMSLGLLLMGIVGPITAGILTSAAIAGVYRAAGKNMIPFEALILGVALQTLDVLHGSCTPLPAAAIPGHVWACAVVSRALEEICVPELILTSPAERAHVGVGELDIFTEESLESSAGGFAQTEGFGKAGIWKY
uniref:Transmembrane protein 170A n=1 Tax=Anser cygnoides TaxID=8845 RepID=A0A8B9EJ43_ANSCY